MDLEYLQRKKKIYKYLGTNHHVEKVLGRVGNIAPG
jgi:hypothetical protein